ncbi:hypothetical protein GH722_04940 [Alphaproteobacteria bacterium HT1-32]|nr:hypothetical protein [Alphaproteobacteria bacterium HT1-32]
MTDFTLDGNKRFGENATDFLDNVKDIDPEMAAILEANWNKLLPVVRGGERDTKSRTAFNEAIAAALDDFLTQEDDAEAE